LFLDRDGVVNVDRGYVGRPKDFQFQAGIFELCRYFQNQNYKIIIITNQSGVARGYYTEADLQKLHKYMLDKLQKAQIVLTDILYCASSNDAHPDRKPNPGLFLKARAKHALDLSASVSIGDQERDITAARKAGIKTNILLTKIARPKTAAKYTIHKLEEVLTICTL
jgi:D,D-heptose 1,7-bisphosphate phosphatase